MRILHLLLFIFIPCCCFSPLIEIRDWHAVLHILTFPFGRYHSFLIDSRGFFVIVHRANSTRRHSSICTRKCFQQTKPRVFARVSIYSCCSYYRIALLVTFRYVFETFDGNQDGMIDFNEFLLAIVTTSQGDLTNRLEVAFEMLVVQDVVCESLHLTPFHSDTMSRTMDKSIRRN
jgi:hypothetical protein